MSFRRHVLQHQDEKLCVCVCVYVYVRPTSYFSDGIKGMEGRGQESNFGSAFRPLLTFQEIKRHKKQNEISKLHVDTRVLLSPRPHCTTPSGFFAYERPIKEPQELKVFFVRRKALPESLSSLWLQVFLFLLVRFLHFFALFHFL